MADRTEMHNEAELISAKLRQWHFKQRLPPGTGFAVPEKADWLRIQGSEL
ncbi:hypothetical protein [Kineobactrum sediminis]|nr:hypothetical protein [Kineobactrum sediminis]